ncbi:MAG: hypothetical protein ACKVT1_09145 [Dehalococcoidia bacterium]
MATRFTKTKVAIGSLFVAATVSAATAFAMDGGPGAATTTATDGAAPAAIAGTTAPAPATNAQATGAASRQPVAKQSRAS